MDLNQAIKFAQLVNAVYAIQPGDLANQAGQAKNAGLGPSNTSYEVITSVYANDLATEINPLRAQVQVSIGLVLQSIATGDAVVAIRGTEGILEWLHDGSFLMVPCPFLAGAGHTEDGFTQMYKSLAIGTAAGSPTLAGALAGLNWKKPVSSLTICGHSLGGALATLLALDVAANTPFKNPVVYTYASPKTGGSHFVDVYNHMVPSTFRIANRLDLVPKLPLPPLYEHVLGLFDLNPVLPGLPLKFLVKPEIACLHILTSYLFLLSRQTGGAVLPLSSNCQ
jgi:lipase (class 3)